MLNLQALEEAFGQIEELSQDEVSFYIGQVPVTLRLLGDGEEVDVVKYANVAWEVGGEDSASALDYIHRLKVSTLAFAIVQIGDISLRDPLVATGEYKSNGEPITRERVEVSRRLVAKWSGAYVTRAFQKYGEMTTRSELEAERAIELNPVDHDLEISRLKQRIEMLEKDKERTEQSKIDVKGKQIKKALGHNLMNIVQREHLASGGDIKTPRTEPVTPPTSNAAQEEERRSWEEDEEAELARLQEDLERRSFLLRQRKEASSQGEGGAYRRQQEEVHRQQEEDFRKREQQFLAQQEAERRAFLERQQREHLAKNETARREFQEQQRRQQAEQMTRQERRQQAQQARQQAQQQQQELRPQQEAHAPFVEPERLAQMEEDMLSSPEDIMRQKMERAQAIAEQYASQDPRQERVDARQANQRAMRQDAGLEGGRWETRKDQARPVPMKRRQPPHAAARQAAQQVRQQQVPTSSSTRPPQYDPSQDKARQVGVVQRGDKEIPVFKLPGQEISPRTAGAPPSTPGYSDPTPGRGNLNPRFTSPKKKKKR